MAGPEGQEQPPRTQVEFSSAGGGPGAKKPTAVGTGDDGENDWLSQISCLTPLTREASGELQHLLSAIANHPSVICALIVGHDGELIAKVAHRSIDAEAIGVWALGVFMNTEHVIRKLGHDRVHQIVSLTSCGFIVIADFGDGLLVVISESRDLDSLLVMMRGGGVAA